MKKIIILLFCFTLIFTGCQQETEQPQEEEMQTEEERVEVVEVDKGIAHIFPETEELVVDGDYVSKLSEAELKEAEKLGVDFTNYRLPMINLDTPYAHYVNYFIQKNILSDCIYSNSSWEMDMNSEADPKMDQIVDYEYTETDNILSLLIKNTRVAKGSGEESNIYYCFNLDLETGEEIKFREALSRLGYPEDIMPQFRRATREAIEKDAENTSEVYMTPGQMTANRFIDAEYLFQRQDDQGLLFRFYINDEGLIELPSALMDYYSEGLVCLPKEAEQEEINPAFTLLQIPEDKAYGSFFIGGTYDQETALGGAIVTMGIYNDFNIPGIAPDVLGVPGYMEAAAGGSELYWIVPKYRNAIINLYGQYMDENGELQVEPVPVDYTVGNALVFCNPSDLFSNVMVEIIQNGETIKFSPGVSLKDGSNMVEEEGYDLNDTIPVIENFPEETDPTVESIMIQLSELLPKG